MLQRSYYTTKRETCNSIQNSFLLVMPLIRSIRIMPNYSLKITDPVTLYIQNRPTK